MKPQLDHPTDKTDAIRSEIDTTRHRMDETIDAISRRLKGRHLVDEALYLLRKQQENGNMTNIKNKISESADTAYHSVVDTIKAHPVPVALVGAGVGWLIYERSRSSKSSSSDISPYRVRSEEDLYSGSLSGGISEEFEITGMGEPGGMAGSFHGGSEGTLAKAKGKVSQAVGSLQQKASDVGSRIRDTSAEASESARRLYEKSRQTVSTTVSEHPLQSGLALLAVGVIAGLLLPTPRRLRQTVEPKARELGERVRATAHDLVERGTHVVESATDAARQEAKNQGLMPEGASSQEKNQPTGAGAAI